MYCTVVHSTVFTRDMNYGSHGSATAAVAIAGDDDNGDDNHDSDESSVWYQRLMSYVQIHDNTNAKCFISYEISKIEPAPHVLEECFKCEATSFQSNDKAINKCMYLSSSNRSSSLHLNKQQIYVHLLLVPSNILSLILSFLYELI